MEIYDSNFLIEYSKRARAPFSTHPHEHNSTAYGLLNKMVDDIDNKVKGFYDRIKEAGKNYDPMNFYGFMTEIKIIHFLLNRALAVECLNNDNKNPNPDFKVGDIYIEANTHSKQFPYITMVEVEINKIMAGTGKEFKFKRRHYLPFEPIAERNIQQIYEELFNSLKGNILLFKDKELQKNPHILFGNPKAENEWLAVLEDKNGELYDSSIIENAHGHPPDTLRCCLKESLTSKIKDKTKKENNIYVMKNDLNNKHSNILWSDFSHHDDFRTIDMDSEMRQETIQLPPDERGVSGTIKAFSWQDYGLPSQLDAQIITACDISKGYDKCQKTYVLINERSSHKYKIEEFTRHLFPSTEPIKLQYTAEELCFLEK